MALSLLPAQHPQRVLLHNEIHARPAEIMQAPLAITHIVMLTDAAQREASREHVAALLRNHHRPLPDAATTHVLIDLGAFRLRWEQHTEFVAWTFTTPMAQAGVADVREPETAIDAVPRDWLATLPGQCLSSLHLWALNEQDVDPQYLMRHMLQADTLVGSRVSGGAGAIFTDFAIHPDGFSRMLLLAGADLSPRRLGRLVQRVLEIETYRMAALLGLPAARKAAAVLATAERELAELANAIRAADRDTEPALLDRLTRLAGQVESEYAATHSRFSASSAYFELVDRRIQEIQETRVDGIQTIREFMDRRLTPARATCEWATRRQNALSERVSRVSSLLRTRVEIEQQQSSQQLLGTMNDRQGTQLKLQSTVEGLSVAAITYYITGLISYLAKGGQKLGWPWSPESTAAVAIPVVALGVWWSLRRLHHKLFHGRSH
ncbi:MULTISPECIES: DUF3422 family protein [Comamonas]|mgnify:FL=1|uniref:DUF3422 domain-containing protein n=2 Tax=Comamonas thiooxydans TaxID=363952 RepID=A0A096DBJ4_9BURK|nr:MULTISPECIES: DUF3422 domain-containing protein [Comamonas]KGG86224.1 membrane protein [Comamonas thiooxydans]KGG97853.1 membrane protein [Comamonas thiooxydans]KGH08871.1 membrane protein [Comamonas thiooxydans]KKI11946.1 membrane protein [Comamonas thiooxydans]MDH1333673.1 DUF3422 domain-containing protein [Comamonas thiooxydans]